MMATYKEFKEGLEILEKYSMPEYALCAEHDIIYVHTDHIVSEDDERELDKLGGWHWNEDGECWAFFT